MVGARAMHQQVQCQQGKGQPLGGQKLGLGQVGHAVRGEGKDNACHNPCARGTRQFQHQKIGAKAR